MILLRHELQRNFKSLLIWGVCVAICLASCIMLFPSMKDSINDMAAAFSDMGSISSAFGMDKISIATLEGYYVTTVSVIFALGGAMFAAMTGALLLSKEEEGHTVEFIYTLPLSRTKIVWSKYISLVILILAFNLICVFFEVTSFWIIDANLSVNEYFIYHVLSFFMQVEIGSICFLISAFCHRKQIGLSLGISIFLYLVDVVHHTVPNTDVLKYCTPFYYSNATELFVGGEVKIMLVLIGLSISIFALISSLWWYVRKDLHV